jgi:hypothetical protein
MFAPSPLAPLAQSHPNLRQQIHDLNNVPLVSGYAYVKWHIEGSTRADCRARTNREPIKDHKVVWRYTHDVPTVRLNIGRGNMLQDQWIVLEVHQEYSGGRERILLGIVRLNLAEYAKRDGEPRRYLMQDSKINSTLKIGIEMNQVGGDTNYETPALRGAQVFSGIAGIMGDQRDSDESRSKLHLTSLFALCTDVTQTCPYSPQRIVKLALPRICTAALWRRAGSLSPEN